MTAFLTLCCVFVLTAPTSSAGEQISWVFQPGTFTHDPTTGARVAQYARKPPIEPLPDPRLVTSGYRRTQTTLRGTDGSRDTYYRVQSWGNGRGGIDAEWERFHDAWLESFLTGGYYQSQPALPYGYVYPHGRHGAPAGAGAYPHGTYSSPQQGYYPPYGYPAPPGSHHPGYAPGQYGDRHPTGRDADGHRYRAPARGE